MTKSILTMGTLGAAGLAGLAGLAGVAGLALAQTGPSHNAVSITVEGDQRCVRSNGTPDHAIGVFPNRNNPHGFRARDLRYCFDAEPVKGDQPTPAPTSGVALNGTPIRPDTADYYDATSPRGHSRDPSSGWNLEGIGNRDALGIDDANGHVDHTGLYHYHGAPVSMLADGDGTLIGYAADGFEIHYVGARAQPSYQLKQGQRPTEPFGAYDGAYVEDWAYVPGSGDLDACNGGMLDGRFVYFATDGFPFYPRCFWGSVSADFADPSAGRAGGGRTEPMGGRPRRGGPLAAAAAELGVSERALAEAVGPPPPNVERAAQILGVSEERLRDVLRRNRP